jgi:hypothetical protein
MLNTIKSEFTLPPSFKQFVFFLTILLYSFFNFTSAQWIYMSNGLGNTGVYSLAANGSYIFAGTNMHGVYYTTNNGITWNSTPLNSQTVLALQVHGIYLLAGVLNNGVYVSANNGLSWTQANLSDRSVNAFAVIGSNIYAGTSAGTFSYGVYKSTNNGLNWGTTLLNNRVVYSLATDPNYNINNIFAGTYSFGVYLSTNNSNTWTQTSLNNRIVYSITVSNNYVFAGTETGVYKSTNIGANWTQTNLNNVYAYSLVLNNNNIFAGTHSPNSFSVSTNLGISWTQRNEGLSSNLSVNALILKNNILYAGITGGTSGNGVYVRSLGELIGINLISSEVPNSFSLSQNYPNPFNPNTNINFQIAKKGLAKLIIYDILGREVTELVNEQLYPGIYRVEWDGTNFPSAVYFYKLVADGYSETKKMVLIK